MPLSTTRLASGRSQRQEVNFKRASNTHLSSPCSNLPFSQPVRPLSLQVQTPVRCRLTRTLEILPTRGRMMPCACNPLVQTHTSSHPHQPTPTISPNAGVSATGGLRETRRDVLKTLPCVHLQHMRDISTYVQLMHCIHYMSCTRYMIVGTTDTTDSARIPCRQGVHLTSYRDWTQVSEFLRIASVAQ